MEDFTEVLSRSKLDESDPEGGSHSTMKQLPTIRCGWYAAQKAAALWVCVLGVGVVPLLGQPVSGAKAVPVRPPVARTGKPAPEHLAQWMDRHRSLPLEQQQGALEREPGFRDLPAQTQQRMRDRLTQLNTMPEDQRRRLLERTEAMEQLSPAQRQQVRGAMSQLGNLPVDRRRLVARAFRDIREMPPEQRQAVVASERFRGQFSEGERSTLSSLLAVEPYLPAKKNTEGESPR